MNYKKINLQLKNENLIDEKGLLCHSYKSYTSTSNKVIYMEMTRIGNDKKMPSFMLLSINDDKLNISYAGGFGGFKKYYASFKLSNLEYEDKFTADRIVDIYKFNVLNDQSEKLGDFFIIAIKHKEDAKKLVEAIIDYNK
ncbi:MAG: hypothetical protein E7183_05035 [Erysipelotrichaceae bacterium]|nr:hypothetical protein [Erysipelotrichaceae bacterium]